MDYVNLLDRLKKETYWLGSGQPYSHDVHPVICDEAATAIKDLMARCTRLEEARERANEAAHQWEGRCKILETRLETAEKIVKEYQDTIVPGYRDRAEKSERELQIAVGGLVGQCKYCRKNQECTSRKGSHLYCWEWSGEKEG